MVHLRARDGRPPLAEPQRRAGEDPDGRDRLPKSSLGAVLRGEPVPTRDHVVATRRPWGCRAEQLPALPRPRTARPPGAAPHRFRLDGPWLTLAEDAAGQDELSGWSADGDADALAAPACGALLSRGGPRAGRPVMVPRTPHRKRGARADRSTTRVEVYIGHVSLMFLKPIYEDGLHIRGATAGEFAMLRERHGIPAEKAPYTWMLERDGDSFVGGGHSHWREAEYELMGERQSLLIREVFEANYGINEFAIGADRHRAAAVLA
ncbi:hypothetical protein ACFWBI_39500 [Streptomyces sp. NPDC059982]|uniref:hypothetical protein n=1 Tax=unclassified Streptomyces TaxID=2593676 RepID=UPI0036743C0D